MKKIGIIIQARSGSTRLHNKMLLPFYKNLTILDIIIQKLKFELQELPLVVATSTNIKDEKIKQIAENNNVFCYRGNEDDVLRRFIDCAKEYNFDTVIRVCADNPFIEIEYTKNIIKEYIKNPVNYISYCTSNQIPSIKTHFGFFTELVEYFTLCKINDLTKEIKYHEHVTNFIYENALLFSIKYLSLPSYIENSNVRLTVDTKIDFENTSFIYAELLKKNGRIDDHLIIDFVNNNEEIKVKMQNEIKKNSK